MITSSSAWPAVGITIYDEKGIVGESHDYLECTINQPRIGATTGQLKLRGDDPLIAAFMKCDIDPVRVIIRNESGRFDFSCDRCDYNYKDGQWTALVDLRI